VGQVCAARGCAKGCGVVQGAEGHKEAGSGTSGGGVGCIEAGCGRVWYSESHHGKGRLL
jgi:hypothetical protein